MKNKGTAVILCLLLGAIGIHKFYLGSNLLGLLYLIFCWTFIPFILAFIDFFILIFTSEKEFNKKYNAPFIRNPY